MAKILLTSVIQPFGKEYGDGRGTHFAGSWQILWAQGIYRPTATTTQWGIDLIAENLESPTVTLHYPTMKAFIKEIKKGYDYIGIAFIMATFHKTVAMVDAIRTYAPDSKIILGGYGAALGKHLEPYADHVCREEGVAFMRKLLGEDTGRPIVQPNITGTSRLFSIPMRKQGYVFIGLGCPNGCDFCVTSAFFNKRHVKLLPTGKAIYDAMVRLRRIHGEDLTHFYFSDEEFLLSKKQVNELHDCMQRSDLPPLCIQTYASINALSRLPIESLVEIGIDFIWIGYEGKHAGYPKQQGKPYAEIFAELKSYGISILASMVIGFDYQTPEIIQAEFEELIELEPTMCQFLILQPAYGTPLFEKFRRQNRMNPTAVNNPLDFARRADGFHLAFEHPHVEASEMESIQRELYKEEFARLGPGVFRMIADWLTGYRNLRGHTSERIRRKAAYLGESAHQALPLMDASKMYLTERQRVELSQLQHEIEQETGKMTFKEKAFSKLAYPLVWWADKKMRYNIGQQPEFTRNEYRVR